MERLIERVGDVLRIEEAEEAAAAHDESSSGNDERANKEEDTDEHSTDTSPPSADSAGTKAPSIPKRAVKQLSISAQPPRTLRPKRERNLG